MKGILIFASNVSTSAKSNLFYINAAVADYQRGDGTADDPVHVDENILGELHFWKEIDQHKAFEIKEKNAIGLSLFSDASSYRWAFSSRKNGLETTVSCDFNEELMNRSIYDKEAFSIGKLVEQIPNDTLAIISTDNSALCAGLKKGMLGSEFANLIFKKMLKRQADHNIEIFYNWIDTVSMNDYGVDKQSRKVFRADLTLSETGVIKARRLVPFNVEFDWFAFSSHNPFMTRYASIDIDLNDDFCVGTDFIGQVKELEDSTMNSGSWFFPPQNLAKIAIKTTAQIKLGRKGGIAMLLPANWVAFAIASFRKIGSVRAFKFAAAGNRSLFNKKNRTQLSLVICCGCGYDEDEGGEGSET